MFSCVCPYQDYPTDKVHGNILRYPCINYFISKTLNFFNMFKIIFQHTHQNLLPMNIILPDKKLVIRMWRELITWKGWTGELQKVA